MRERRSEGTSSILLLETAKSIAMTSEYTLQAVRELFGVPIHDPEYRREQLLRSIENAITPERIKAILESQNPASRHEQLEALVSAVDEATRRYFDPCDVHKLIGRRGRQTEHEERDQRMLSMRRRKLTYGQIARQMRAEGLLTNSTSANDPQTVRAAIIRTKVREKKKRQLAKDLEQIHRVLEEELGELAKEIMAKRNPTKGQAQT